MFLPHSYSLILGTKNVPTEKVGHSIGRVKRTSWLAVGWPT